VSTRHRLRAGLVGLLAGGALLLLAGPASAHAYLDETVPADGAVLATAPSTVVLQFDEHVVVSRTSVVVYDGAGRAHPATSVRAVGAAGGDTEQPMRLEAQLPAGLGSDAYRVVWRTLSADDLHASSGDLVFGVGQAVAGRVPAGDPPPVPLEGLLRWTALLGLAMLAGAAVVGGLLTGGARPAPVLRRLRLLAAAGGGLALAGRAAVTLEEAVRGAGVAGAPGLLLHSRYGLRGLLEGLAVLGLLLVVRAGTRTGWTPLRGLAAAAMTAAAAVLVGLLGHEASVSPTRLVVAGVHIATALTWAGSVVVAAFVLLPALRSDLHAPVARRALRRFGPVAGGCVGLLSATGLLLAGRSVTTLDALLLSPYGQLLLAKTALVAGALAIGGATFLVLRRHRRLRPAVLATEAGLLVGVVAVTGLLATAAPPVGNRWQPPVTGTAGARASSNADDLLETVALQPNLPGRNIITVGVLDTRRPAPGAVAAVTIALVGPQGRRIDVLARPAGPHRYTATVDSLGAPGAWRVTVSAARAGLPDATAHYDWSVASVGRSVRWSAAPLRPWTDAAAVALLALASVGAAVALARRRGRRPGSDWALPVGG
jgi:copper transport protein